MGFNWEFALKAVIIAAGVISAVILASAVVALIIVTLQLALGEYALATAAILLTSLVACAHFYHNAAPSFYVRFNRL